MFDLKKSQVDPTTSNPSIKGPKFDPKMRKLNDKPQISHNYGTRSKTKGASASVNSVEPDIHYQQRGHSGLGHWVGQIFGSIKEAVVQQLDSAKRWSLDNMFFSYLTGDHQSSFKIVLHMTLEIELIPSWLVCCKLVHDCNQLTLASKD